MNNWKDLLKDTYKFPNKMIEFHEINWEEVFKLYESKKSDKIYEMPDLSIWDNGWEIIIKENDKKI